MFPPRESTLGGAHRCRTAAHRRSSVAGTNVPNISEVTANTNEERGLCGFVSDNVAASATVHTDACKGIDA
jgi:hypothetical protein